MTAVMIWRVFTWAANPNGPGFIVACTIWDNQVGPQQDSYRVLRTFDERDEAKATAESMQQQYDAVRRVDVSWPQTQC